MGNSNTNTNVKVAKKDAKADVKADVKAVAKLDTSKLSIKVAEKDAESDAKTIATFEPIVSPTNAHTTPSHAIAIATSAIMLAHSDVASEMKVKSARRNVKSGSDSVAHKSQPIPIVTPRRKRQTNGFTELDMLAEPDHRCTRCGMTFDISQLPDFYVHYQNCQRQRS
jgi:hypothetical protein